MVVQLETYFYTLASVIKETFNYVTSDGLECGPMPNVMAALPNTGGALCSTPQSVANAQYSSVMQ